MLATGKFRLQTSISWKVNNEVQTNHLEFVF
jgi:hypothetical protein